MKHFLFVSSFQQRAKGMIPVLLLAVSACFGQVPDDYGFQRQVSIPNVYDLNNQVLQNAWAGGLNACQFSKMNLFAGASGDDLLVFDRTGNRILPFVGDDIQGSEKFYFMPDLADKFPKMSDWVRMVDYNGDNLADIFTYGYGGITVYKNTSSMSGGLSFEWKTNQILSYQFGGYSNIYTASVDYPVIKDMDGDGDVDILNFWILGSYINYHKNLSMEKYGNADSLDFQLTDFCWGKVKESENSNILALGISCPFKFCDSPVQLSVPDPKSIEHVGSTLTALDLNNDSVQDLLLGDVSYPTIIALQNTGTKLQAYIGSIIDSFPANTKPINMTSFPCTDYLDVNHDGKMDLLASPFESAENMAENVSSVWYYKNTGTDNAPVFSFQRKNFLQDGMIEVGTTALPMLYDIDQDGLTDMLIGNDGLFDSSYMQGGFLYAHFHSRLFFYKNTGSSASPEFSLADTNYAQVDSLNIRYTSPAMGDIDGDGDPDMILGTREGTLILFRNNAGPGNMPAYDAPLRNYAGIDAGDNSAPQIFDLDKDNLQDLLIGKRNGRIAWYRNSGSATNPVFALVTDTLGGVDVRDPNVSGYGFTTPCFFRTATDETRLFCGSLNRGVVYYKNIDTNLNGQFSLVDMNYLSMKDGEHNAPALAYLDNDQYPDLVVGNASGGLAYFKGTDPEPIGIAENGRKDDIYFQVFPNPGKDIFSILWDNPAFRGKLRLRVTDLSGRTILDIPSFSPAFDKLNLTGFAPGVYLVNVTDAHTFNTAAPLSTRKIVLTP